MVADTDTTVSTDTNGDTGSVVSDADFEATDWTEETHGNDVDPNVDEVFDTTQVKRLDLVVTEERWQRMLEDMTATYGELGGGSVTPGGGAPDGGNLYKPEDGSANFAEGTFVPEDFDNEDQRGRGRLVPGDLHVERGGAGRAGAQPALGQRDGAGTRCERPHGTATNCRQVHRSG